MNSPSQTIRHNLPIGKKHSDRELDDILIKMLSSNSSEYTADLLDSIDDDLQSRLLDRAKIHDALILLSNNIINMPISAKQLKTTARDAYIIALKRDYVLAKQAAKIAKIFQNAGIPLMGLKGPFLWRSLGLSSPIKISNDIDILIHKTDGEKAHEILIGLGYKCTDVSPHEASYVSQTMPPIDLHWDLLTVGGWGDNLDLLLKNAWDSRSSVEIEGANIPVPGPNETMLYLALHSGCHHLCADWASIYEISQCSKKWAKDIDWNYIRHVAKKLGILNAVYTPLWISAIFFEASIPDEVIKSLKPFFCRRWLENIGMYGFKTGVETSKSFRILRTSWNILAQPGACRLLKWVVAWVNHHKQKKAFTL